MTSPHPTPLSPCLSDLEIADLIAGRLQGEDHARAMRHVTECESCYEIYAEAQALLAADPGEQDGDHGEPGAGPAPADAPETLEVGLPEPLPFRPQAKKIRWFPAIAAGLIAGIALALFLPVRNPAPPRVATPWPALGPLPAAAAGSGPISPSPGDQVRGPDKTSSGTAADFLLGVDWAHLEEACQRGDAAAVASTARNIETSLAAYGGGELSKALRGELVLLLENLQSAPADAPAPSPDLSSRLSRELREWGYEFDLGRFAEAGRLAALAGRRDFFAPGSTPAQYLRDLQEWDGTTRGDSQPLAAIASDGVRAIAASWPADPVPAGEPMPRVAEAFASLIHAYDKGPSP